MIQEYLSIRIRAKAKQIQEGILPSSTGNKGSFLHNSSKNGISSKHKKAYSQQENNIRLAHTGANKKSISLGGIINGIIDKLLFSFEYILYVFVLHPVDVPQEIKVKKRREKPFGLRGYSH